MTIIIIVVIIIVVVIITIIIIVVVIIIIIDCHTQQNTVIHTQYITEDSDTHTTNKKN